MRPKGQHEWECDSHCAITRTDVLLKFKQRWRQLYNADIIFNLTQRLDLHRSMTFKSTWVKAHQDDDQLPGQVLSDAALRNNDLDSLANAYLLATDQPQTMGVLVIISIARNTDCFWRISLLGRCPFT